MAIDPIPGIQYIPTQRPEDVGPTSNAIRVQREYAKALMDKKYTPPNSKYPYYTWANGLSDAANTMLGAWNMKEADERERQHYARRGDAETPVIGKTGSEATPTAASGGAAPASPFPQDSQAGSPDPSPSTRTASRDTGVSSDADPTQTAAMRLHTKAETGKAGMAALFNISPDTKGSKSYGPLGLNSRSGSAAELARENPGLGLTAEPGTPEFDAQWKRAAALNSGADMQKAHEDWHQKHIMKGLPESMIKAGVDPSIANDPRVQTYMADRKVQMGGAGLNNALMYGKLSNSPEEFIHRISQADKQRIPYNFASYLQGHPNDIRGLNNRIDLRHNTALSGADPDLTANMIDYHNTKNTVGTQLAQNGPPQSLPQGVIQSELAKAYRGMISAGASPEEAAAQAERLLMLRGGHKLLETGVMPQYQVDEYGRAIKQAPGEIPTIMPGVQPGYFGSFKEEPDTGGAGIRTTIERDPATGQLRQKRQWEIPGAPLPPGPSSSATPPVAPPKTTPPVASGGAIVNAPPAAPVAPSIAPTTPPMAAGGILATAPPVPKAAPSAVASDIPAGVAAKPGQQLALADTAGVIPAEKVIRNNLTQLAQSKTDKIEMPNYDLDNPKTDFEKNAIKELDYADKHPVKPPTMPDIMSEAFTRAQDPNTSPYARLDAMRNIKPLTEVHKAAVEDQIKTQNKGFAELQKNYRDSQVQAVKLAPELKVARDLLDSPDFHPGPASKLVENVRGLQEEAQSLFKTWAADGRARNEELIKQGKTPDSDPSTWEKAAEWIKPGHGATANQVYSKILSGSILQSLRGMLGPNAGQFRVQELKMLEQAFGNPNLTLPANKAVMSMVDKINDRHVLLGQMADAYLEKHRVLDPAFESAVARFEQKNPVFSSADYKDLLNIGTTGKMSDETPSGPVVTPPPNAPTRRIFNPATRKFE